MILQKLSNHQQDKLIYLRSFAVTVVPSPIKFKNLAAPPSVLAAPKAIWKLLRVGERCLCNCWSIGRRMSGWVQHVVHGVNGLNLTHSGPLLRLTPSSIRDFPCWARLHFVWFFADINIERTSMLTGNNQKVHTWWDCPTFKKSIGICCVRCLIYVMQEISKTQKTSYPCKKGYISWQVLKGCMMPSIIWSAPETMSTNRSKDQPKCMARQLHVPSCQKYILGSSVDLLQRHCWKFVFHLKNLQVP